MIFGWLRRASSPTEGHRLAEALIAETDAGALSWKPYATNIVVGYSARRGDTEVTIALVAGGPMLSLERPGGTASLNYDSHFAGASEASAIWRLFKLVDGPCRLRRAAEIAALRATIP